MGLAVGEGENSGGYCGLAEGRESNGGYNRRRERSGGSCCRRKRNRSGRKRESSGGYCSRKERSGMSSRWSKSNSGSGLRRVGLEVGPTEKESVVVALVVGVRVFIGPVDEAWDVMDPVVGMRGFWWILSSE